MFGWDDPKMARIYTRKAAQKKLAASGAAKLSQIIVPPSVPPEEEDQEIKELGGGWRMVPLAGLEPARCFHHLILSQARLPIPPQGLAVGS